MHAIAWFSAESVRLSGVSATRNSFSRVSGGSNGEQDEREKRTGSRTTEPTLIQTVLNEFDGMFSVKEERTTAPKAC